MIKAIKDYNEMIWKNSCRWLKLYWKQYLIFTAIVTALSYCWIFRDSIIDFFGIKDSNKTCEEEEAKYEKWN